MKQGRAIIPLTPLRVRGREDEAERNVRAFRVVKVVKVVEARADAVKRAEPRIGENIDAVDPAVGSVAQPFTRNPQAMHKIRAYHGVADYPREGELSCPSPQSF